MDAIPDDVINNKNNNILNNIGYIKGKNTEIIDLRSVIPSQFLRPHAQHGLSFRKRMDNGTGLPHDYIDKVRAMIRMDLADAHSWLGSSETLSAHAFFPSLYYDEGYRILMGIDREYHKEASKKAPKDGESIGSIAIVGP